ncbi:MAG: hypothetical protein KME15_26760 [Drouetiella hepatica Uher 2000/2452]|jgi:hypothetical protein|uniref:PEP-CTERM sorting domain-containing protein n=1 Tax=Drouetiella hepatica Uher 2000/2452 TaxID=904376 RepID=A0A951UQC8_9CYAN|nr:hypothetical protein [Drouetiella hepatica Uher 2000/2452]
MKLAIGLMTKNSLKFSAVATLAIGACFVSTAAQAFNIVPIPNSSTTIGAICTPNQCNVRSNTNLFSFRRLTVDTNQRVNFITTFEDIIVTVDRLSRFDGIFTTSRRQGTNLDLTAFASVTFGDTAAYDLNGGRYNQSGNTSGRPKAIPENPVGSLLGAGAVGVVLLLKGRRRFSRLAQSKMTASPEQNNL